MRKFLIKILIRLLDREFPFSIGNRDEKLFGNMFVQLYMDEHFRNFLQRRILDIIKEASASTFDRDKNIEYIGRRLELERIIIKGSDEFRRYQKDKEKKIEVLKEQRKAQQQ